MGGAQAEMWECENDEWWRLKIAWYNFCTAHNPSSPLGAWYSFCTAPYGRNTLYIAKAIYIPERQWRKPVTHANKPVGLRWLTPISLSRRPKVAWTPKRRSPAANRLSVTSRMLVSNSKYSFNMLDLNLTRQLCTWVLGIMS